MDKFLKLLIKLPAPEIIGLARMLGVKLYAPESTPENVVIKDGEVIINELAAAYSAANRALRRKVLQLMREATK